MKKFVFTTILFLFLYGVGLYSRSFYLMYTGKYKQSVSGAETYLSIHKSKQKKKARKVLLGDSVGQQLFENSKYNDTINSFACNQAIGLVGHYALLNNYINAGNDVDTVYMIFRPFSFFNNLNEKYTFNYFLKPFYNSEYKPLFTKTVYGQIHKIPFNFLSQDPTILTSDWTPDYKTEGKKNYTFLSPISVEYLLKIKELSIQHNFKLIILPTPISLSKKQELETIDKSEIVKNGFSSEFRNYFDQIIYLADSSFMDGVHLNHPEIYTAYYKDRFISY